MKKGHKPYIRTGEEKREELRLRKAESDARARFDKSLSLLLRLRPDLELEALEFFDTRARYVQMRTRFIKEMHRLHIYAPVDVVKKGGKK